MPSFEDKQQFVERAMPEIKPLLGPEEQALGSETPEAVDMLLERYRSKIFSEELATTNPDAIRVLVTASDPGGWNAARPLIEALEHDPRCNGIAALVSAQARQSLEKEFPDRLAAVRGRTSTFMEEAGNFFEQNPIDVVVATVTSLNGPEGLALYAGKSVWGAKKIFLIAEGWGTLGSQLTSGNYPRMDAIEAIFCPDDMARRIFQKQFPEVPKEKFQVVGSPSIDSLRVEHPDAFAEQARNKLDLEEQELAILYCGDVSSYCEKRYGSDPKVNEKTFVQTLGGIIELAKQQPERRYALLLRPHPRDSNKAELLAYTADTKLPPNLRIIRADGDSASMQEARYASDVVLSIGSTENLLVPRLGKSAIFLGYQEGNLGGEILNQLYGTELIQEIGSSDPNVHVSGSVAQVQEILRSCERASQKIGDMPLFKEPYATEKIKDAVLSG